MNAAVTGGTGPGSGATSPGSRCSNRRQHVQHTEESCMKQMLYCLLSNQAFREKRKRLAMAKGNWIHWIHRRHFPVAHPLPIRFQRCRQQLLTSTLLIAGNTINSVSKIDRLSRVLFPVTFFLLNAFYWWGYVTKDDHFTWAHLDKFKFYWTSTAAAATQRQRCVCLCVCFVFSFFLCNCVQSLQTLAAKLDDEFQSMQHRWWYDIMTSLIHNQTLKVIW